ncbi:MAG: DUF2199 domain-containing protein [Candidatus Eremiobacteraeota bacterium]|nr:DUF2199 domain-containing protein [Candidatus Eremiobacteraeota bacterium]
MWAIPEPERSERARFDSDLCQSGERYFIRCVLYIPFNRCDDAFGWGAWAEVSKETFIRYLEVYDRDASKEPLAEGTLANTLPLYPDAKSEAVTITFGDVASRPMLIASSDSKTSLAEEQRSGMDQVRYHDIMRAVGAL